MLSSCHPRPDPHDTQDYCHHEMARTKRASAYTCKRVLAVHTNLYAQWCTLQESPSYCSKAVRIRDSVQNTLQSPGHRVLYEESQRCYILAQNEQWHQRKHNQLPDLCRFPSLQSLRAITDAQNPRRSWSRVAADLFSLNGRSCIVLVDYYCNFLEVSEFQDTSASSIIQFLQEQLSRHGFPDV